MTLDFNIDNYLRLSLQDILLASIATLIIVLVARHFFWNKLLAYLEKRKEYVNGLLEESRQDRKEAYALRNEYQRQLDQIHEQADQILMEARGQADARAREIVAQARQEADFIEQQAREQIEVEKLQAQQQIRETIGEVAVAAAGQILNRDINYADQQAMIESFIDQELGDD